MVSGDQHLWGPGIRDVMRSVLSIWFGVIMRSWKMRFVSLLRSSFLRSGLWWTGRDFESWCLKKRRLSTLHSGGKKNKWTLARWSNSHGQHKTKPKITIYSRNTVNLLFFWAHLTVAPSRSQKQANPPFFRLFQNTLSWILPSAWGVTDLANGW